MTKREFRPRIDNASAKNLFLARHCLADDPRKQQSRSDLLALIKRIGFVQVDSINTVARAHDMILFARNQTYQPQHLKELLETDRDLFEHWTHDAAIIPTEFYPYWHPRFARDAVQIKESWKARRRPGFVEIAEDLITLIKRNGPAMARELGSDEKKSNGGWWDWCPSKTALEYLWRTGELAICHRKGFQKVYDLSSRVVPARHNAFLPDQAAFVDWACSTAIDRLGFATSGEISAFWGAVTPKEAAAWCQRKLGDQLIEVDIECADGSKPRTVFARPDVLDLARDVPALPARIRILSPFDPALRDRKRTKRLFGFDYRIEVFIPAAKRQYGYYVFPILEGNQLVGRIDMKRSRGNNALNIDGLWLEPAISQSKQRMAKLDAELDRYRRFAGCARVEWHPQANSPKLR